MNRRAVSVGGAGVNVEWQQIYDEAAELNLHVFTNWVTWEEVIQWADSWISRLDSWPDELTEISLNGRHKDSEARMALAELAKYGHFDALKLIQLELKALDKGKPPKEVVNSLYSLTYDTVAYGGHEYMIEVSDILCKAIYQLDYTVDSLDPEHGWANTQGQDPEAWLSEEIKRELGEALSSL